MNHTAVFVKHILENARRFEWSLQGLGMLRLYLNPETRLHVWSGKHRVPGVTAIHDHPWGFTSTIISGSIVNYIYREAMSVQTRPFMKQRIQCGPDGCSQGEPESVALCVDSARRYWSGDSYTQAAPEIHETLFEDGTVSLIEKVGQGEYAHVFYPAGATWVSARPRQATWEEVIAITRNALRRMV